MCKPHTIKELGIGYRLDWRFRPVSTLRFAREKASRRHAIPRFANFRPILPAYSLGASGQCVRRSVGGPVWTRQYLNSS